MLFSATRDLVFFLTAICENNEDTALEDATVPTALVEVAIACYDPTSSPSWTVSHTRVAMSIYDRVT